MGGEMVSPRSNALHFVKDVAPFSGTGVAVTTGRILLPFSLDWREKTVPWRQECIRCGRSSVLTPRVKLLYMGISNYVHSVYTLVNSYLRDDTYV